MKNIIARLIDTNMSLQNQVCDLRVALERVKSYINISEDEKGQIFIYVDSNKQEEMFELLKEF